MAKRVQGKALRVGHVIETWWRPHLDVILSLEPYRGPLGHLFPDGAQIASFLIGPDMTIDNGEYYEKASRFSPVGRN